MKGIGFSRCLVSNGLDVMIFSVVLIFNELKLGINQLLQYYSKNASIPGYSNFLIAIS
jgi:hypothetical protein